MRRYKKQISRIVTIAMLFAFLVGNSNMVHKFEGKKMDIFPE